MTALPDGLREALGQVLADQRREWRRERELIEAQSRETIAELRARIAELETEVRGLVADRLAALKDGAPGEQGAPGRDGRDGKDGADGKDGVPGRDGADGAPGKDGERGADGAPGRDGIDGRNAPPVSAEEIAAAVAAWLAANPPPAGKDGADGKDGVPGRDGADGADGAPGRDGADGVGVAGAVIARDGHLVVTCSNGETRDLGPVVGRDGVDGKDGEPGADGPAGRDGRDGADGTPGRDGADGRSFDIRGTWAEGERYHALDAVTVGGALFVARRDDPGPCPGDGWQLAASQGKRGNQGERGQPGAKGEPGQPGAPVTEMTVDGEGLLMLVNGDGSTVTCDLYPLLDKIGRR